MPRLAVLLRGINVGRGKRLAMADLRAVLEGLGCTEVSTYLQSGNAFVTADPDGLAARVEAALPVPSSVLVLTADSLAAAVDACPYRDRAEADPKSVHVAYLGGPPAAAGLATLDAAVSGDDRYAVGPGVLYLTYAGRSIDSPLTAALAKADLGVVVTTRNWRTAVELVARTR